LSNFIGIEKPLEPNGVQGVVGSNPIAPTNNLNDQAGLQQRLPRFFFLHSADRILGYRTCLEKLYRIPVSFQEHRLRFRWQRPFFAFKPLPERSLIFRCAKSYIDCQPAANQPGSLFV
jgi:hypothetical protein